MKHGKFQKEEKTQGKKINKLKIGVMLTLLVAIVSTGIYFTKNSEKKEAEEQNTNEDTAIAKAEKLINTKAPIIWYYNRNEIKEQIENQKVFQQHIRIAISRGNITIFTRNGEDYRKEYSLDKKLPEGEYKIRVEAEDGTSCEREFIIDTIPPKISGITNMKTYQKEIPTIRLEEIADIKEAILTKNKKEKIDIKQESIKQEDGSAIYEVKQEGEYVLKVVDIHGTTIYRSFEIAN